MLCPAAGARCTLFLAATFAGGLDWEAIDQTAPPAEVRSAVRSAWAPSSRAAVALKAYLASGNELGSHTLYHRDVCSSDGAPAWYNFTDEASSRPFFRLFAPFSALLRAAPFCAPRPFAPTTFGPPAGAHPSACTHLEWRSSDGPPEPPAAARRGMGGTPALAPRMAHAYAPQGAEPKALFCQRFSTGFHVPSTLRDACLNASAGAKAAQRPAADPVAAAERGNRRPFVGGS